MKKRPAIISVFLPYAGCKKHCIYCNQSLLSEQEESMTPDQVYEFVKKIACSIDRKKFDKVDVAFYGGTFTDLPLSKQEKYLSKMKPFIESGEINALRLSTRPDSIDEKIVNRLINSGVRFVELGVQSFDDQVLQKSLRGYNGKQAIKACKIVEKSGLKLGIHLMVGLLGDTKEKSVESAVKAAKLNPDLVRIHPILILKDTKLAKMYKNGEYSIWSREMMIETICKMMSVFKKKNIHIGRVGLQITDAMQKPGAIIAGKEF